MCELQRLGDGVLPVSTIQAVLSQTIQPDASASSLGLINAYYRSQLYLAGAATVAGVIAFWQALEANRSRRTASYSQLSKDFITGEIEESRAALVTLAAEAGASKTATELTSDAVHRILDGYRHNSPDKYIPHARLIFFFENVGVLIAQKYVKKEDVALMFGGAFVASFELYKTHIEYRRREVMDDLLFEHFQDASASMDAFIEKRKRKKRGKSSEKANG